MEDRQTPRMHKLSISNRAVGSITGVKEVLSFDANEIMLETDLGILMIKGEELHVTRLTVEKGEVEIDGSVESLTYSDMGSKGKGAEGLLGRLFK